jgi:DNA topoisomerase-1
MPTSLVIVESPAKCKKIESYLGPGYKVIASFGHLRTISGLESIDIENNFLTKYSVIQEELKLKQIEKIRSEIAKSDEVIIATDDDREGEAIGWHICDLFGLSITNTKRIIFHEITEPAIQSAISHPKRINMDIVQAQQSRQILDLLVGFTFSPILWNCISKWYDKKHDKKNDKKNNSLSAGRCQTPALRLVYDNFLDIKASPGKLVYNTVGCFTNLNLLFDLNKQFSTNEEVAKFLEKCKTWDFLCSTTSPKKVIKKAPEPLTTSSLQQLASNELRMSPKETMKYAQQLYEGGYITYMRTDSKKYSQEFIDSVKKYTTTNYGERYVSQTIDNHGIGKKELDLEYVVNVVDGVNPIKKTVAEKKGIPAPQEAHEAIRPVNIEITELDSKKDLDLDNKLIKLYNLIWKRTLESCMPSAQYNSVSAKLEAPNETEFVYKTEQPIFLGWQIVSDNNNTSKKELDKKELDKKELDKKELDKKELDKKELDKKELDKKELDNNSTNKNNTYQYITTLKQKISLKPKKIDSKFTMNELKSHYTEARLVQLLEEKGIGRPSTFASLVDKIQERNYVEKQNIIGKEIKCSDYLLSDNVISETVSKREFGNEKNKLVIQPLGIIVIEFLISNFDLFFNYSYTKEMEDCLDLIAKGKTKWDILLHKCHNELTTIQNNANDLKKFSIEIDNEHTLIIGKHGPVVKCVNKNDNKKVSFLPVKKDLDLDYLKQIPNLSLEDVIDNSVTNALSLSNSKSIGKYKGQDLFVKKGKYGVYAQWGKETRSLKEDFSLDNIVYMDVLKFLEKDMILDPSKPVGLVRELSSQLSIRTGKYGDYIFYKKPRAKTPTFLKLNGFDSDYKKCDKILILNWIKLTYKVE